MGMRDWLTGASKQTTETVPSDSVPTFHSVMANYDLVGVVDNEKFGEVVVVTERVPTTTLAVGSNISTTPSGQAIQYGEIGTSSPSPFINFNRHEYNNELRGVEGLRKYDMMRRGDATVRKSLRLVKTPVLAGRWFMKPEDPTKTRDVNAADFVWCCLTEYMSISWTQVLTEALLMCDFGYYMFEKVWTPRVIDGQDRIVLQKLAPRHPMDVREWVFDAHGGPAGVFMNDPDIHAFPRGRWIPIEKLLVFSFDMEGGNIAGISMLRSAYKHWYYKDQLYKIDAIQKERHGIGIPIIKLPINFTPQDRAIAENLGRNLRTNERAHVVLPPNWELMFAKLEGQPVDSMVSIAHHDKLILENVLAPATGKDDDAVLFMKSTRFIANVIVDVINKFLIPELIGYNFQRVGMPVLAVRRVGEQADWRTLSFALRNLIGSNLLTPDDNLEDHLRDEMDLPAFDPTTARKVATPQAPGSPNAPGQQVGGNTQQNGAVAGTPRQTPVAVAKPAAKNAGADGSGGK
jgi:hypothetical protein